LVPETKPKSEAFQTLFQFNLMYLCELLRGKLQYFVGIQKNHQTDATIFNFITLTFIYSSKYLGCSPAHHQKFNDCSSSLWFYLRIVVIVVLCSWSGRLKPARPQTAGTNISKLGKEILVDGEGSVLVMQVV
jgi:hypothetical protein